MRVLISPYPNLLPDVVGRLFAVACFLPGRAKDLSSHPRICSLWTR
jgi:hypothetical protein